MIYNREFFDAGIDRKGTKALKWTAKGLMQEDTVPLWVADMDFACAEPIREALVKRAQHACYGYTTTTGEDAQALIGFWLAHMLHHIPTKGQRKWRGMLLVPWVIPPALSTLGWWWMFDPSYSSINWILNIFAVPSVPWLGEPWWARASVIIVNVWYGAPFFMIMYLAALKSVPEQLYEAAAIDGATSWQRLRYVTLPMMANIISITVLFSLIVTFANYDIVRVLTNGGPRDLTHVFASYAFQVGILAGNIPRGAAVSLFMFPILALIAFFVLRGVNRRNREEA